MNTGAAKEFIRARGQHHQEFRAFTLTELLTVISVMAMLACVLLSVAFTNRSRVQWAQCANNLRQIGVALSLYSIEQNSYAPICGWRSGSNPWETYETCRVYPSGTTNVVSGFYGLGLLFQTGMVSNPKVFYCPSLARQVPMFSYGYYSYSNSWPSTPANSSDEHVRVGYTYYPQLRATEKLMTPNGFIVLPKLIYARANMEFGGPLSLPAPAKWADLNPKKSITTDLVAYSYALSHRASGSVTGLNALFPDGHVAFQPVRGHDQPGSHESFDPTLWNTPYGGPGNDPSSFRIIMNDWTP